MTLFGFAVLIAPVVGPTLGGWITDSYSWRWVFLINVPVGILALGGCYALLRDPDYLVAQRMELKKQPFHFDSIGLSLLVIVMVSWEVMLGKGQEWDWLGDPFWRVQTLAIFFAAGLVALILWELRHRNPVVNFRVLGERNFAACCIMIFCAYLALYASTKSLLGLLQSLFGYDALSTGDVATPARRRAARRKPQRDFIAVVWQRRHGARGRRRQCRVAPVHLPRLRRGALRRADQRRAGLRHAGPRRGARRAGAGTSNRRGGGKARPGPDRSARPDRR